MRRSMFFGGLLLLSACASGPKLSDRGGALKEAGRLKVYTIDDGALKGASGLARTEDGRLLAVAERGGQVFELSLSETGAKLGPSWTVEGAAPGLDLESIAMTGPGELVIGTESSAERSSDLLLIGRMRDGKIRLLAERALPYRPWGLRPADNQGLEALCSTEHYLVAGTERFEDSPTGRRGGVAVARLSGGPWVHHSFYLSSDVGKLSALACRELPGGQLELYGVERHFEVTRLIRWRIQATRPGAPAPVEVLMDLGALFAEQAPNFEGLSLSGDELLMISDNQYKGIQGPTVIIRVRP